MRRAQYQRAQQMPRNAAQVFSARVRLVFPAIALLVVARNVVVGVSTLT